MRRAEFLDLLQNNLQAFITELENCKKDDVDFLFEIDQDGNTILHDVVRLANNAPNSLYLQLIKLLLENGAKTHIVNYAYNSVLQIATAVEVKKLLLARRTVFTKEEAKHWVQHFLLNQKEDDEIFNLQFLNEIVSLIAGMNFHGSLGRDQSDWIKQLGHILEWQGSVKETNVKETKFEGTYHNVFLSFRIRAVLQMIVETEQKRNSTESDLLLLDLLYQELVTEAEMIHVCLAVSHCRSNDSAREQQDMLKELSVSLHKHIISEISNSSKVYSFPLVWNEHALYINFCQHPRNPQLILIRIDNLGLGVNGWLADKTNKIMVNGKLVDKPEQVLVDSHLGVKETTDGKESTFYYPYYFCLEAASLPSYLSQLLFIFLEYLNTKEKPYDQIKNNFAFIYKPLFFYRPNDVAPDKEDARLRFENQVVGNCVAAGHQIGLKSRLRQEKYFRDFCEKESETLMKLRNPAVRDFAERKLFHIQTVGQINHVPMSEDLSKRFRHISLIETQMNLEKLNQEGIHFRFVEDNIDFNYQYTQQDFNKLFEIKLKQNGIFCEVVSINHERERLRTVIHQLVKNKVESQTSLLIALQIDSVWSLVWLYKKEGWMIKALTFSQSKKVLFDLLKSILIEQKEDDSEKILVSFDNNCVVDMPEIHRVEDSGPLMIEIAREFKVEEINQQSLLKFDQDRIMADRTKHAVLIETQREQTTQLHKEFENLALVQEFSTNKTVLVTGQAGYGKSRFCQYLLEMSDTQQLGDFKQIFWVKLRYVGHLLKDIPQTETHRLKLLVKLLIQSLPAAFSEDMSTWWVEESIANSLRYEKVLFMFDGVDELTDTQQIAFSKLVSNLQDNQFCLVTTRPQFVHYFSNFSIYKLQSLTFSEVYQFIDAFFAKNLEKSNQFKALIQARHSWHALVVVPFHLELLCNLFLSKTDNEAFPETLTEVYQKIFVLMLKRAYQKKHGDASREKVLFAYYDQAIKLMERLAFDLICKGVYRTQALTQNEKALIEAARQDINDIGMLHIHGEVVEYMFQSFCEFLCARYISKNLYKYSEVMNVFIENKYHPKFARIWPLVAGLVSLEKPKYLSAFWDILSRKPWDLVGGQFIPLLMSCLEETNDAVLHRVSDFSPLLEQAWQYIQPALIQKDYQLHWLKKTLIAAFAASPRLRDKHLPKDWLASLLAKTKEKSRLLSELNITVLDQNTLQGLVEHGKALLIESSALVEAKKQNKVVGQYELSQKLTDFLDIIEVFSHLSFFPEQLDTLFSFIELSYTHIKTYNGNERYSCVHVLKKIEGYLLDLLLSQEVTEKQGVPGSLNTWANPDLYQNDPFGYPFIAVTALETLILKSSLPEQKKLELFVTVLKSPAFGRSRFSVSVSAGVYELMLTFKTYGNEKTETEIVNLCLSYNCPARFLMRMKINNALNERNLFDRLIRIAGSFAPRGFFGGFPYKEDRLDALYGLKTRGYLSNHLQDPEIALQTLNALIYGACRDLAYRYVGDSARSMILNSNTYILALFIDQIHLHYFPKSAPNRRTIFEDQVSQFRSVPDDIDALFDNFLAEALKSIRPSKETVFFKTEKFKKVPLTPAQLKCVNTQLRELLNTQRLCLDLTKDQRRRQLLKCILDEIFVNYTVSPSVFEEITPTSGVIPFSAPVFPISGNNTSLSREEMLQIIKTPSSDPSRYKLNQIPFKDLIQIFLNPDTTDDRWLEIVNNRLEFKGASFFSPVSIQLVWSTDNQLLINNEKIFLTPSNLDLLLKLKEFIQAHFLTINGLSSYSSVFSESSELPKTFDGIYKLQPSMAFFRNANEIKLEQSRAQQEYVSKSPVDDFIKTEHKVSNAPAPTFFSPRPTDKITTSSAQDNSVWRDEEHELHEVTLASQRAINKVKIQGEAKVCKVVPISADGNCGFTAVQYYLTIMGHEGLANQIRRAAFIETVTKISNDLNVTNKQIEIAENQQQELRTQLSAQSQQALVTEQTEALQHQRSNELSKLSETIDTLIQQRDTLDAMTPLIVKLLEADGTKDIHEWQTVFHNNGYWLQEAHFKLLSRYYNLRFHVYYVGDDNQFTPVPTYEVIDESNHDARTINIHLVHLSMQKDHPDAHLSHFEALIIEPTEQQRENINAILNVPQEELERTLKL